MAAKGIFVFWRSMVVVLTPLILLPLPLLYPGSTVSPQRKDCPDGPLQALKTFYSEVFRVATFSVLSK